MPRHLVGVRALRVLALLPVLTLALFFSAPASVANADATTQTAMMTLHNQMRFAIGAPTIPMDPRVALAAQNHANYSAANRTGGHFETAGLPYYTGYSARDRVIAAGLTTSLLSEGATRGREQLARPRQPWGGAHLRPPVLEPSA